MKAHILSYFFLSLLLMPPYAFAHGGGQSVQKESEEYRVTIDAVSAELSSGITERINFELERMDGKQVERFSHVWVRLISLDGSFLFGGNIAAAPEGFVTGISYLFPQAGVYDITIRFFDGEHMITEAELPVLVGSGGAKMVGERELVFPAFFFLGGLLLTSLLFLRWNRKHAVRSEPHDTTSFS